MSYKSQFQAIAHCPITGELMQDPVITRQGTCYEKSALEEYLIRNKSKTPAGEMIYSQTKASSILDNTYLKKQITRFIIKNCGHEPSENDYRDFVEQYEKEKHSVADTLEKAFQEFYLSVAICPITHQPMKNPVIAPDGICYEKDALDAYLKIPLNDHRTPTDVPVPTAPRRRSLALVPNCTLKRALEDFSLTSPANLTTYVDFFSAVAKSNITFQIFPDPVVHAVLHGPTQIEGGIASAAAAAIATRDQLATTTMDPSFGARLDSGSTLLRDLIAYVKLQNAILTLKEKLKNIPFGMISSAELRELVSVDILSYQANLFEAHDDTEDDFSPVDPAMLRRPRRLINPFAPNWSRVRWRTYKTAFSVLFLRCIMDILFPVLPLLLDVAMIFTTAIMIGCLAFVMPLTSLAFWLNPSLDPYYEPAIVARAAKVERNMFLTGFLGSAIIFSMPAFQFVPTMVMGILGLDAVAASVLSMGFSFIIGGLTAAFAGKVVRTQAQGSVLEGPSATANPYVLWKPQRARDFDSDQEMTELVEFRPLLDPTI